MSKIKAKIGVLLINLGTPEKLTTKAVRRYLAEFLWDKRVINLPACLRWVLLHGVLLRLRPRRSARLYQRIWLPEGSPLLIYSEALTEALAKLLGEEVYCVTLGMCYGQPTLTNAINKLKKQTLNQIIILPLYPQYSATTTAASFDAVARVLAKQSYFPSLSFISGYASFSAYIAALAQHVKQYWNQAGKGQKLIFSFHGLPERSRKEGDPYYEECCRTSQLLAQALELKDQEWQMTFQSRLGLQEWLKPYTVSVIQQLPQENIQHVQVLCPGFAVDCLETLEEIALLNKAEFLQAGGQRFDYIPCLNASDSHAALLAKLIQSPCAANS